MAGNAVMIPVGRGPGKRFPAGSGWRRWGPSRILRVHDYRLAKESMRNVCCRWTGALTLDPGLIAFVWNALLNWNDL